MCDVNDWHALSSVHCWGFVTPLLNGCQIISHLVCKWASESVTFGIKEQCVFVWASFVCLSIKRNVSVPRREISKWHATQASCQFHSWKSYQPIIQQLRCECVTHKPAYWNIDCVAFMYRLQVHETVNYISRNNNKHQMFGFMMLIFCHQSLSLL